MFSFFLHLIWATPLLQNVEKWGPSVWFRENPPVVANAENVEKANQYVQSLSPIGKVNWWGARGKIGDHHIDNWCQYNGGLLIHHYTDDKKKMRRTFLPGKSQVNADIKGALDYFYGLYYKVFNPSEFKFAAPKNPVFSTEAEKVEAAKHQIELQIREVTEMRRRQHEAKKASQPIKSETASASIPIPVRPMYSFSQKDLQLFLYDNNDSIDLEQLDSLYGMYKSFDLAMSFDAFIKEMKINAHQEIKKLLDQYAHIPEDERQVCTFYQYLRLHTAFRQQSGKAFKVGLDLLESFSVHWKNISPNMHFDQWFNIFIVDNPNVLPNLNPIREAYQRLSSDVKEDCSFYDFVLFYAAFQWEEPNPLLYSGPSPIGKVRVDFAILENVQQQWIAQHEFQTMAEDFPHWLVAVGVYNSNLKEKFEKHWLPYYFGYYRKNFPEDDFIAFLKYQFKYETEQEEQIKRDEAYASYLQDQEFEF